MPLEKVVAQSDFSAGMFQSVARHLIPENGAYDLRNVLLDESGAARKRGGSSAVMTLLNASASVFGIWDGYLTPGARTVVYERSADGSVNEFTVGDSVAGGTPADIFSAGSFTRPVKFVEFNGMLFVSAPGGASLMYAGSLKNEAATYAIGSVAVTNGSKIVTGTGTAWLANADAGMIFKLSTYPGEGPSFYVVESVDANNQITLRDPYMGPTNALAGYNLLIAQVFSFTRTLVEPIAGRVATSDATRTNRVYLSLLEDPFRIETDAYHELPGGVKVLGLFAIRDTLFAFTSGGVWALENLAFDFEDAAGNPQHRVTKVATQLVLWDQVGVARWSDSLVVPAMDGVWLFDGQSAPVLVSRSVQSRYLGHIRAGYRCGGAVVFENHYLLPILNTSYTPVDLLVCKLDQPHDVPGVGACWPWARLENYIPRVLHSRRRIDSSPVLIGGANGHARLSRFDWFEPSASVKADADGSNFGWTVETRDFAAGTGNLTTVRKARVRYSLVDAGSDNPTFSFAYAAEDGSYTTHADTAGETAEGTETWLFNKRGRLVRLKLASSSPAASAVVKSIEGWARPSGKD